MEGLAELSTNNLLIRCTDKTPDFSFLSSFDSKQFAPDITMLSASTGKTSAINLVSFLFLHLLTWGQSQVNGVPPYGPVEERGPVMNGLPASYTSNLSNCSRFISCLASAGLNRSISMDAAVSFNDSFDKTVTGQAWSQLSLNRHPTFAAFATEFSWANGSTDAEASDDESDHGSSNST